MRLYQKFKSIISWKVNLNTWRALWTTVKNMEKYHGDQWFVYHKTFNDNEIKGKVLDCACGTWLGTYYISKMPNVDEIVGVDIYQAWVDYANSSFKRSNLIYKQWDVTSHIDYSNEYFDTIISFETIEHLYEDERKKYLWELTRLLKKDGKFFLSTPFNGIDSFLHNIEVDPTDIYCHKLEFNFKLLKKELKDAWLNIEAAWYIRNRKFTTHAVNSVETIQSTQNSFIWNIRKAMPEFVKNRIQDLTWNPFSIKKYEYIEWEDFVWAQTFYLKLSKK